MTTAVTTLDDVQDVAATVAAGLDQLLHAEYWKLPVRHEALLLSSGDERAPPLGRRSGLVKLRAA